MLPLSVVVATVAMASGVEGATFFAPIFLLALGLPAAVAGGLIAGFVRDDFLQAILGMGLIAVALSFLTAPDEDEVGRLDRSVQNEAASGRVSTVVTAEGEEIHYAVCNRVEGMAVAATGALFMGMLSTGLGELNGYFLLRRCRVPSRVAVATGVLARLRPEYLSVHGPGRHHRRPVGAECRDEAVAEGAGTHTRGAVRARRRRDAVAGRYLTGTRRRLGPTHSSHTDVHPS